MPFVKLDTGILDSSLWSEPAQTCKCWITLLAMADATGIVHSTAPGIARRANLGLADTEKALEIFESPDSHSRSLDSEGRRIKRVDGGYQIVNYEKYRERDYTAAERQKRWRERRKIPILSLLVEWDGLRCGICGDAIAEISEATIDHITPLSRGGLDVPENRQLAHSGCNQRKSNSADPSAWRHPSMPNRNAVTRVTKRVTLRKQKQSTEAEVLIPAELDTDGFRFAWKDWVQHRKEIKHPLTPTSIKQQLSHLSGIGEKRAIAAIRFTIRKGWQGLVEESTQRGNGQTERKKPAPTGEAYQRVPMAREPTDEEFKAAAEIAKRETEALRSKLQK